MKPSLSKLLALLLSVWLTPALHACVTNVIPFGVTGNQLTNLTLGSTFVINDAGIGSGTQGKLNLAGYPNTAAWQSDMLTLGCHCPVCLGPVPVITGNAQVSQSFLQMGAGAVFIMPLVDSLGFSGGGGSASIVGFVLVKEIAYSGGGSSWTATMQLLSAPYPFNELAADSDGDGLSDFQEYYTGTSPTNSASVFAINNIVPEGEGYRVTWLTGAGKTNALQRSDGTPLQYSDIFTITNTGTTADFLDTGAATNSVPQFYRIRLVP